MLLQASEPRSDSAPFHDDATLRRNRKASESTHKLCRYVTKLEDVVSNSIAGTLPEDMFPWVRAPPGRKGAKGADGSSGGADPATVVPPEVLARGAHGEAPLRFANEVLADREGDVARSKVTGLRKLKEGRFAKSSANIDAPGASGAGGGAGGGGSAAAAAAAAASDPFTRALEPPKQRAYVGGRVVVFVVGGVTQLEVAALDRLSRETGREIIVGGSSLLTSRDLINELYQTDPDVDDGSPVRRSTTGAGTGLETSAAASGKGGEKSGAGGAFDFPAMDEKFV